MSNKRYPDALRERAVRIVLEARSEEPTDRGVINRIAAKLGVGPQSLRTWVDRVEVEVDAGRKPRTTTADAQRIKELKRENKELRRTNEIPSQLAVHGYRDVVHINDVNNITTTNMGTAISNARVPAASTIA